MDAEVDFFMDGGKRSRAISKNRVKENLTEDFIIEEHAKFTTFNDEIPLWIPIREKDSLAFPFDVQGFNTLIVPRNKKGELEEEKFFNMLNKFMETITERAKKDRF